MNKENLKQKLKESYESALSNDIPLHESSLSRIEKHISEHQCGVITAFRYARHCGEGDVFTYDENKRRNAQLRGYLLAKGYGVTPVKGSYIENYKSSNQREVQEESLFVVDLKDTGALLSELFILGNKFEQDSIAYLDDDKVWWLYGTNNCPDSYPGFRNKVKLGKSTYGKTAEFFSRVNGRPFVFESNEPGDILTIDKLSIPEIRSITHLVEDFDLSDVSGLSENS